MARWGEDVGIFNWRTLRDDEQTVRVARHTIDRAHAINRARNNGMKAAEAATMVDNVWCHAAALLMRCADKLLLVGAASYSRQAFNQPAGGFPVKSFFVMLAILFLPLIALAQASLPTEIPVDVALAELLKLVGGMQGFSALGIATLVTQAVMLFFRTPLANFAGKWKLLIAAGVAIIVSFLGLLASGVDWKLAFLHGAVIASVNVFLHQLVKQLGEKKDPPPAAPAA